MSELPMKKHKHTPGPWETTGIFVRRNVAVIPKIGKADICAVYADGEIKREEARANARLIAAAPDLLAACKMIASIAVGWQALTPGDIAEVHAAIAKAEGEP